MLVVITPLLLVKVVVKLVITSQRYHYAHSDCIRVENLGSTIYPNLRRNVHVQIYKYDFILGSRGKNTLNVIHRLTQTMYQYIFIKCHILSVKRRWTGEGMILRQPYLDCALVALF